MSICRKPYPTDVSTEGWSLVAPYLLLQREDGSSVSATLVDQRRFEWRSAKRPGLIVQQAIHALSHEALLQRHTRGFDFLVVAMIASVHRP